jgi:ketosteroid isomerase-like protein
MTRRFLLVAAICLTVAERLVAQSSVDEAAIRAARARSNHAIAAHDLDAAAAVWAQDYVGVSSGNARAIGRDDERAHFATLIATRKDVVFVRTPSSVTINTSWGQAGESGRWSGKWSGSDGVTRVGGIYFAKWKKADGEWKIIAETFVQTACSGTHYCDAPPGPAR